MTQVTLTYARRVSSYYPPIRTQCRTLSVCIPSCCMNTLREQPSTRFAILLGDEQTRQLKYRPSVAAARSRATQSPLNHNRQHINKKACTWVASCWCRPAPSQRIANGQFKQGVSPSLQSSSWVQPSSKVLPSSSWLSWQP